MKSGIVGKIVSWIAFNAGILCLLCLGYAAFLFFGLLKDPGDQVTGWTLISVMMAYGVLGGVSFLAGLLGLFLTNRSSRRSWFGVVVGLVAGAVLGLVFLYLKALNS